MPGDCRKPYTCRQQAHELPCRAAGWHWGQGSQGPGAWPPGSCGVCMAGVGSGEEQAVTVTVSGGSLIFFSPGSRVRVCVVGRGGLAGGSVFLLRVTWNPDKGPVPLLSPSLDHHRGPVLPHDAPLPEQHQARQHQVSPWGHTAPRRPCVRMCVRVHACACAGVYMCARAPLQLTTVRCPPPAITGHHGQLPFLPSGEL